MKAVLFSVPMADAEILRPLLGSVDALFVEEDLTAETAGRAADADIISVFVGSGVTKDIIDALPNLKYISTRSVGFDHIDVAYAKSKGIAVSNTPAYGTHTVAEFAFTLILALSRNIIQANTRLHTDGSFDTTGLMGVNLFEKTIGIVGTGKIGKNVARIATGFGMKVQCFDLFPDQAFAQEIKAVYIDLPTLLATSDVVTLHAPYTKETRHLINATNISQIKKGALLINTARGELVDTGALLSALDGGILAGAGLDVFEGERTKNVDERLIHHSRVISTPHVAYFTREAKAEILRVTAENIVQWSVGSPQNLVSSI